MAALEAASPPLRAIAVTDYCITRSYELMKAEKENGRLKGCDMLFPYIKLRLNTGTIKDHFVNIHILASPEDPDHVTELNRFLGRLSFSAFNDRFACTPEELIRLGRRADSTRIDDEAALEHGCTQFRVSLENPVETYRGIEWARRRDAARRNRESGARHFRQQLETKGLLAWIRGGSCNLTS